MKKVNCFLTEGFEQVLRGARRGIQVSLPGIDKRKQRNECTQTTALANRE